MIHYQALHAFQGDPNAKQISFQAGTLLLATHPIKQQNGWIWLCYRYKPQVAGWCPISYVAEEAPAAAPSAPAPPAPNAPMATATPIYNTTDPAADDEPDWFASGPMGGGWNEANDPGKGTYVPQGTFSSPTPQAVPVASGSNRRSSWNANAKNGLRNVGSVLSSSASKAANAAKSGATAAGTGIRNVATEANHRMQDMQQQRQQQQQQYPQKPNNNNNNNYPQQRTQGQQMAVDAGNHAARGAVASGIVNGVFHGPQAAMRGAARGAVFGGAYGAVSRWKPFGK